MDKYSNPLFFLKLCGLFPKWVCDFSPICNVSLKNIDDCFAILFEDSRPINNVFKVSISPDENSEFSSEKPLNGIFLNIFQIFFSNLIIG